MRTRALALIALASVLAVLAAACGGGGNAPPGTQGSSLKLLKGGTAHVALLSDVEAAMDPAAEYYSVAWTLLRTMQRTLLTYPGAPAPQGNQTLPDLAASQPTVSSDQLTWTFRLKPNVKFSPPVNRAVVCADIKAGIERMFGPAGAAGYPFYYTVIKGAPTNYPRPTPPDIPGIQCPSDSTIVFQLNQPTGDFNFRVAMPATSPIPAAENVTKGHDRDWGRFQVSTGCYMWQGEDKVSFAGDASAQKPATGYHPNVSMTLVRNPNWDPTTDDSRKCYVNQYDIQIGGSPTDLFNKVQSGSLDWVEDDPSDAATLQAFRADSTLSKQIDALRFTDSTYFIYMNMTVAPFDDLHIRRAVNWIVNKDALLRIRGGPDFGQVATHILPPSINGAPPTSYDPYASPGHRGDLAKAQAEMKLSKYDTNHDGTCDAPQCKDVFHVTDSADPYPDLTASLSADLAKIGITLKTRALDRGTMYNFYQTPAKEVAMGSGGGWGKDYSDGLTFIDPLFNGANIKPTGNVNYPQVNDPTVNTDIATCKAETGSQRAGCWGDIDRYLMENIAPIVPWRWGAQRYVFSSRVARYQFDQFAGGTAFEQIALTKEAIAQG